MSDSTGTKYIETGRDDSFIYGDRFFDGEFMNNWVQAISKPKTPEQIQKALDGYFIMDYERRLIKFPNSIIPGMVERYNKLKGIDK